MSAPAPMPEFSRRIMFNRTWDLLSNRWKFYIVYLLAPGEMRFGDLRRCCVAVSRPTFTAYLRALEQEGFVVREAAPEGNAVAYRLTSLGRSAVPAVSALIEWGFAGDTDADKPRAGEEER